MYMPEILTRTLPEFVFAAEYVRRTHRSKLLSPMNPFERRLIHTALNDFDGVETKSEGEGLYKQVRILPTGKTK